MRLCERKVGLTSPGIQGKNLVETDLCRCPLESVEKGKPAIHKAVIKNKENPAVSGHEDSGFSMVAGARGHEVERN